MTPIAPLYPYHNLDNIKYCDWDFYLQLKELANFFGHKTEDVCSWAFGDNYRTFHEDVLRNIWKERHEILPELPVHFKGDFIIKKYREWKVGD